MHRIDARTATLAATVALAALTVADHVEAPSIPRTSGSSGCAAVSYGFASLPSNWSSTISSGGGRNGCWATVYTGTLG